MQVIPLVGAAAAVMVTADEDTVEPAADVLYKHHIINCQDILLNLTFNENKYLLTAAISKIVSCWVRIINNKRFVKTKFFHRFISWSRSAITYQDFLMMLTPCDAHEVANTGIIQISYVCDGFSG